ncbi:MAG: GntR family transcriptional regulator [Victivallales bacterium]|nr:GntR family transcriptional regulator [Victivallales bacterium]
MGILRSDRIKFRELADRLRDKIDSGDLNPGELIPSEPELQAEYEVSRVTVRSAVSLLVSEGLLRKERGRNRGTMVLARDENSSKTRKGSGFGILLGSNSLYSDRSDLPDIINGITGRLNFWEANLNMFPVLRGVDQFEYTKSIISRNIVDGLFLCDLGSHAVNEAVTGYLSGIKIPWVTMSSTLGGRVVSHRHPEVFINELEAVGKLLADIGGIHQEIVFLGFDGVELERTFALFGSHREASGFKLGKRMFEPGTDIFPELLNFLGNGEADGRLLIIASHNVLPLFNSAVNHLGIEVPNRFSVVYFRHYSTDYENAINRYDSIERDFLELGRKAADMMREIVRTKEAGGDLLGVQPVSLANFLRQRGSVAKGLFFEGDKVS